MFKKIEGMMKSGAGAVLVEGFPAPLFSLPAHDGTLVSLESYRGSRVLIWFYPVADTPG